MKTITRPYFSSAPKIGSIGEPHAMVRSFAPLIVMVAGTGGLMTANSAARMSQYCCVSGVPIHIEDSRSADQKIDARSISEHIANIRDIFAMNMSDLAAVFAVTRPTVYAWLEGRTEKPEAAKRIQQLSSVADEFSKANIKRLDKLLQRPILNGDSLDILKANKDPLAVLPLLKEISEKEAKTRREPKGSGKYRRSLDDVLGGSSVAIDLQG
jgi:DNA-binding transcriptional regulator YiaG